MRVKRSRDRNSLPIPFMILVLLVVIHNFLLGLLCLWLAQKLWRWRRSLSRLSLRIADTEHILHQLLQPAPATIQHLQNTTHQWQQQYTQLGVQAAQLQQLLRLFSLLQVLWPYRHWLTQFGRSSWSEPLAQPPER